MKKLVLLSHFIVALLQYNIYYNARLRVEFNGVFLKQDKVTYNHGPTVNIYLVYKLIPFVNKTVATLENCVFGAVKLTKNDDIDKYKYSG